MDKEPTFKDIEKAIIKLKAQKRFHKRKLEEIEQVEKDLILMLANEEMYEKLRGGLCED